MTNARAAILREVNTPFQLEEIEVEAPRHNEVLVEIVEALANRNAQT